MTNHTNQPEPALKAFQFSLRRMFLWVHIVAVTCSAVVGVGQVLTGHDDDFEVLLTAVTIALASVGGLSCGAAIESRRAKIVPWAGLVFTLIATLLWLWMIWFDHYWREEFLVRTTIVCTTFAVACSHVSLLSLARLAPRYNWAIPVAMAAIFTVATLISILCVIDRYILYGSHYFRWIAATAIIDAAMTMLIPIFHFLSRSEFREAVAGSNRTVAEIDAEIAQLETRLAEFRKLRATHSE